MREKVIKAIEDARSEYKVLDTQTGITTEYISKKRVIAAVENALIERYGLAAKK